MKRFKIDRPRQRVGGGVPRPHADARGFKPSADGRGIRKEFLRRILRRTLDRSVYSGHFLISHIHAFTLPPSILSVKIVIPVKIGKWRNSICSCRRRTNGYG